jgi:iron complex outermembrane receptor protein
MPANPDLKPENMMNYDFSYLQSLLKNKIQWEVTAYFAQGKNLITTAMIEGKPLNVNSGKFINKGIDFAFTYRILSDLKVSGNYSFLHTDAKLTAAPKHKAFLGVNWKTGKFTFAPHFQYINGLYLGSEGEGDQTRDVTSNYALLNCKVSYKALQWLNVFIDGENLTNTSYETYLGFPMPGIVVLAGFDVKF